MLTAPRKVARIKAKGTVLEATAPDTDGVDTLGAKLGVGSLTAELELSLLAVVGALRAGMRTLVPGRARDTWARRKE